MGWQRNQADASMARLSVGRVGSRSGSWRFGGIASAASVAGIASVVGFASVASVASTVSCTRVANGLGSTPARYAAHASNQTLLSVAAQRLRVRR